MQTAIKSKQIMIGDRYVGDGLPVFIIAEIGSNLNRSLATAEKLIQAAADAGADAAKFQTYSADTLYSIYAPRLTEMNGRTKRNETPYELIKRIETPREWLPVLKKMCQKYKILFASTPFDIPAVHELDSLGVPFMKIASYETDDLWLLKEIARTKKPVIMSTGNSDLATVKYAYEFLKKNGTRDIVLLHCVSQYPAKMADVNLKAMQTLRSSFGSLVGFSDHSSDSVASIGAVAMGACVIEKHITLDRNQKGPDHSFSMEPDAFKNFVRDIRNIETAMGDGNKRVQDSEKENSILGRRSFHAALDIGKGKVITRDMLMIKRPGLGLKPREENRIIGKKAKQYIKKDQWITDEMI